MNKFWSPIINNLIPYKPGEQPRIKNLIKLNTNENPFGPSIKVINAMLRTINNNLKLYPDPESFSLKKAISKMYKIKISEIFIGNGSDEVLAHSFKAFFKKKLPILFPDITYEFYLTYSKLYNINYILIPLQTNFTININDYLKYKNKIGGIIFANPNAPTGCLLSLKKIKTILNNNLNIVIIIDEAYIDFGGKSAISLIKKYDNLLIIQTFSKSRSLAGLRIGFAIGNSNLILALEKIKNSFNSYPISKIGIAGATASIKDEKYFNKTRLKIIFNREKLKKELIKLNFEILPSMANFIFIRHFKYNSYELFNLLKKNKILIRHFPKNRINNFLRITIGNSFSCNFLIFILKKYIK
ncbi:histidinol-phosphate transaminase [Candidatus Zinderia endosymbiont of Aphrophora alni]|uniref:histidinol-phosphate transaminase n=1 Tax=Candidatus Zinderia endosymbiont of Aphrophora alni TaxID=3077951 RepID=UPI0030CC75A6